MPNKKLVFASYDREAKKTVQRVPAVVFTFLKVALNQSEARPENPKKAGSWKSGMELRLFLSDGEVDHREPFFDGKQMQEVPIVILNPAGYTRIITEQAFDLLTTIWETWLEKNSTHANALEVHLVNEWLKTVTDTEEPPTPIVINV